MPLNIRNEEVNRLAEKLAARRHISKTDAVKLALQNELRRIEEEVSLRERLRPNSGSGIGKASDRSGGR